MANVGLNGLENGYIGVLLSGVNGVKQSVSMDI